MTASKKLAKEVSAPTTNPNRDVRCREARRLIAEYIWEKVQRRVDPLTITSSQPRRGPWQVVTNGEDWPRITLKTITIKDFDLIRQKLAENKIDIIFDETGAETTAPEPAGAMSQEMATLPQQIPPHDVVSGLAVHHESTPEPTASHEPANPAELDDAIPVLVSKKNILRLDLFQDLTSENKRLKEELAASQKEIVLLRNELDQYRGTPSVTMDRPRNDGGLNITPPDVLDRVAFLENILRRRPDLFPNLYDGA
ncbi:hypothetical protein AOL_s00091g3 [Orbilia oligospora ATCC 24927]|uniref:Uncharacterized protein n=1 Tax=Arthrobotrys oligospora (strain ATCC 24927 / CBS 115.81 / DSM 1491) TaxID=756982 RepID=G1XHV1_ARTOA|nr:hypothetical protein AOL_s00091g3 [Orbilia oligospora ATCC 24927]EGX47259.1 hypothetical protein AOL_s00091g3 [Orbilia oligospora ATCC 24927]